MKKEYLHKFIIGIILLILFFIGIFFLLSLITISSKDTHKAIQSNTTSIIEAQNPTTIKNNLYEIEIIDKDVPEFKESIFVPIKNEYKGKEKAIEKEEFLQYSSLVDGIEINISPIFRYERISAKQMSKDILNIHLKNFENNSNIQNFSASELFSKNKMGYFIINFEEKAKNGDFKKGIKYLVFKETNNSNIYIKYEFCIHPDLANEKTKILKQEILNYLNIT